MAQITLNSTGVASNGSLVLQSNGTTAAVTVDTAQKVGIGTSSPQEKLQLEGSGSQYMRVKTTTTNADIYFGITSSSVGYVGTGGSDPLSFFTANTERARIDSSGNLGIGTTSPTTRLHVNSASAAIATVQSTLAAGNTNVETRYISTNRSWGVGQNIIQTSSIFEIADVTASATRLAIDSSGNVGIGTTSLDNVGSTISLTLDKTSGNGQLSLAANGTVRGRIFADNSSSELRIGNPTSNPVTFFTANTERARIDSSGNLLVAKTALDSSTVGCILRANGEAIFVGSSVEPLTINRNTSDGTLVSFRQDNTQEGTISVSGTTVSYNGGHLSRWAQTTAPKDDTLVKGTVLSNLDAMNVYTDADGNPVDNEQLNKVKVSDIEGDVNVAGVFVNWTHDDAHNVDEINMAMTGDMIIRIAQGTTVQRGDLLMSAGDGTAKPQGDDIVRSKTVAKVTSTHVTCTYPDGSFCVPCVLMAC